MNSLDDILFLAKRRIYEERLLLQRFKQSCDEFDKSCAKASMCMIRKIYLEREEINRRNIQMDEDADKYFTIASNRIVFDLTDAAWDALISIYPEAKVVQRHDLFTFSMKMWDACVFRTKPTAVPA